MPPSSSGREAPISSIPVFLCRIGWFLLSPLAIFAIGIGIGIADSPSLSIRDVLYVAAVLLTIGLRWGSYLSGDRLDAFGEAVSTRATVRSYSIRVALGTLVYWGVVKAVAAL